MPAESAEWDLPKLRASFIFQDDYKYLASEDQQAQGEIEFFDVKFYPYSPIGSSPVFAAASKKHIVVCRLSPTTDKDTNPCEIIQLIRDDDENASNCACCWSKDPETEDPWLCVAGNDAKVKVYNARTGKLARTLVGHGGGINDLATSPDNPQIVASASDDTTVRIWSLAAVHAQQPCVCLLGGEGHVWDLLSVAFHDTGRYVLSAGHDQVINLWALPELPSEHVDVPTIIHYPHFSSSEVHSGLVDCVAFFGDLILSRACHEDAIVLWRIEGFSSEDPVLSPAEAPTTYDPSKQTRSAYTPTLSPDRPAHFTRLLQFHTPDCGVQFFMRFCMYHAPGKHPILAFANAKSRTMFWDLARFPLYNRYMSELKEAQKDKALPPPQKPSWLLVKKNKKPDSAANLRNAGADKDSMVSASPDPEGVTTLGHNQKTLAEWAEMYDTSNSHGLIKPHKSVAIDGAFVGRQVGWSPEGEWCVVVGNNNRALIYQRWAKDAKASTPGASGA
ncbi:WD40-repeat-containing domain protein [Lasiosphaeria hispida]|uniref:WD40-repeat-containing domain protein n=1 Tax=Lasiosphaeria hispida TaxID=260671 RepID=A0AAJ0MDD6_9PEZI|nr:WD40-repeat-containing domain protein [Lasiosphaeria hispida]